MAAVDDDRAIDSPAATPSTSFTLLEARDSHAADDDAQHVARLPMRPDQERYYEYGRLPPPPTTTTAARSSNSFQHRAAPPLAPQPRARADSLHDLFPLMTTSSVFTTPENIMPSLQAAIVIDDVAHEPLTSFHSAAGNINASSNLTVGNVTLNQHSLAGHQLSLGAIFGAAAASVGRAGTASARDPSCHSFADLDASTSGDSFGDELRPAGASRHRASPKQWLVSLYRRFNSNWDSYFLLFTLLLSVAVVPIAVLIAAVLKTRVGATYTARCQLPYAKSDGFFLISTASISTITIPVLNHVVLFVVSLWIAIRCSRSRTRVLRSHTQSSARTNLSALYWAVLVADKARC